MSFIFKVENSLDPRVKPEDDNPEWLFLLVIPAPEVGALSVQSAPACPVGRSGILPERFRASRNDSNLELWHRPQGLIIIKGGNIWPMSILVML